jgi:hypothetical protein
MSRSSDDRDVEGAELVERLRAWCLTHGRAVSIVDTVSTEIAAELIGRSPKTLANWRCSDGGGPLTWRRRSRPEYALADLADFLLAARDP